MQHDIHGNQEYNNVEMRNPINKTKMGSKNNRISKVMENVKMFEQGKSPEQNENDINASDVKHSNSISSNRASINRKRAPYLEVWQCKSGEDSTESLNNKSNEEIDQLLNDQAVDIISGNKPISRVKSRPSSYPVRDNYVEVWTCSTGEEKVGFLRQK